MSDDGESSLGIRGLYDLTRALAVDPPKTRVGILGQKSARGMEPGKKEALTNAEIGAFHEYGEGNNPERSFLRVPIAKHLEKKMEASGAFDEASLKEVIKSGDLMSYMKKIAILAEECVAEAFETGGDGKWPPSDMTHKTNEQTLVETQQLRNSITSEVKEGSR